jgi:gluconolactonase
MTIETRSDEMTIDFHGVGLPAELAAGDSPLKTAAVIAFTEGPAVAADGTVYFSDIIGNRIMRLGPSEKAASVWRHPSGRANGLLFDARGRLLVCEGNEMGDNDGGRRVSRITIETGRYEVLTDRFEGRRYNSPNDIAACSDGTIFFTDPCYGDRSTMQLDHDSVYRISPDGTVTRVLTQPEIERPNGIALSPDEGTLYLVDSCPVAGGNRKIWAFDLGNDRMPRRQRILFDFAPGRGVDGMAVDREGNLYVAAGVARPRGPHETAGVPPGIWILSPGGELRGRIPIPEDLLTNVTFGGDDLKTLYITAGKSLFTARVGTAGFVVHRR